MDFSIGVGPSLSMIKSDIISGYSLYENGFICGDGVGSYYQQEPDIRFQVLGTAGLHYHPDVRNAIGLECWLGPKPKEADLYLYSGYNYGYNNEPRGKNYRMRSLQVSLRHNW